MLTLFYHFPYLEDKKSEDFKKIVEVLGVPESKITKEQRIQIQEALRECAIELDLVKKLPEGQTRELLFWIKKNLKDFLFSFKQLDISVKQYLDILTIQRLPLEKPYPQPDTVKSINKLLSVIENELKAIKPKKGRPKKTTPLEHLTIKLAPIFEKITGKRAKVRWDIYVGVYSGLFLDFFTTCLDMIEKGEKRGKYTVEKIVNDTLRKLK